MPLMPWQQAAADVGMELITDPETGLIVPAYSKVVITIPRQNGKTTLVLSWELDRALNWGRRQRIVYTAQTGKDAKDKLLEDQVPIIEGSPLAVALGVKKPDGTRKGVRRVNGSEGLRFLGGSLLDVLASTESAGHGRTVDLGVIDEAWNDTDSTREAAIQPSQITRTDAQLLVTSTMGTDASQYLNGLVDGGREAALDDTGEGVCYIEYSADENADPGDPATWRSCMPAMGITITESRVRTLYAQALREDKLGDFRRAYLNQRTASDERVIKHDDWDAVCSPSVIPEGRVVFAFDCNPERSAGSVAVADQDGNIELMPDADRGTGWIVPRVLQLTTKWNAPAAVDPAGPAGAFIPELESAGVEIVPLGSGEFVKACGVFYDAVLEQQCKVLKDGRLDAALAAAKKRPVGDAWAWTRKSSTADISPIVAATVAYFAARKDDGEVTFWNLADV